MVRGWSLLDLARSAGCATQLGDSQWYALVFKRLLPIPSRIACLRRQSNRQREPNAFVRHRVATAVPSTLLPDAFGSCPRQALAFLRMSLDFPSLAYLGYIPFSLFCALSRFQNAARKDLLQTIFALPCSSCQDCPLLPLQSLERCISFLLSSRQGRMPREHEPDSSPSPRQVAELLEGLRKSKHQDDLREVDRSSGGRRRGLGTLKSV